ncbi:MAG TPA: AAA family ATPase [Jatrophihabitans sp.]|jgi:DNA repair exonuclease SbcCD ATPase subunit|uniref:AAA family ATPase n=1 Tax=Jatrophihabitans sp. TaxID=1932789 RepID=UPI002EFB8078
MIRHIRLQRWRAYEDLDLWLTSPVTFFVAPNGVGKTSLVEAVRWCLLGVPDGRAAVRAIRSGHDTATAQLALDLPGHPDVRISRSLSRTGASAFSATVDGQALDERGFLRLLAKAWSADSAVIDAVVFGLPPAGKATAFPIRDHLAQVFGVQTLLNAAAELAERRQALATQIRSLRADVDATDEAFTAATQAAADLEAALAATAAQRQRLADEIATLEPAARLATRWEQYRAEAAAYNTKATALATQLADVVDFGDRDLLTAIDETQQEVSAALADTTAAASAAEVRIAQSASAAQLLAGAADQCPTCLRPLSEHERDAALAAHGQLGADTDTEVQRHREEARQLRARLAVISRFTTALTKLRPPAEPDDPDPGPSATAALADARRRDVELAERHGAITAELRAARQRLADLDTAAADQATLTAAAREDLILEVAQNSMTTLADRYLTQRINPLATEISHRWKLLFGSEGLRFGASGQLTFSDGGQDLLLEDLSGAERATALLVTRLLLAASATRASTIWFDEPLEHLDPARRAAVAQTLVRAAQSGAIGQILVTTYEEGLARRLQATAPDTVSLTYAHTTTR